MQNDIKVNRYWIIAGILCIAAIIALYRFSTFEALKMEVTRSEAVNISRKFLEKQNIDLNGYLHDSYVDQNMLVSRYLLKTLGNKEFKYVVQKKDWPVFGWKVIFYKNLSKDVPQTIYSLNVSSSGRVTGFSRHIPDSMYIKSLSKEEATKLVTAYISNNYHVDLSRFKLVETREDNYSKRNDFSFLWERTPSDINGKLIIRANVQGNQVGSYTYEFQVPAGETAFLETSQTLFGIISVIFVLFLAQYAILQFLKKYHQGEIWIKIGKRLFVVFLCFSAVILINGWPGYGNELTVGNLGFFVTKIISIITTGFLVYMFLSVIIFTTWSVGESYSRELWPDKLKSLDAFLQGRFFTLPSGNSLFRGMVIGLFLALVYLGFTILLNTPHSVTYMNISGLLGIYSGYVPLLDIVTGSFIGSVLTSFILIFFTVNASYSRWKKKWVSIVLSGVVTALGAIITVKIPSVSILTVDLLIHFAYGCLFAYIFFTFDLLTLGSALFNSTIIIQALVLATGSADFYRLNFILLTVAFLFTPIVYLISLMRKEEFVLESYGLPAHIQRISERERLKKELEIAAKVQLSLLPKEQPSVPGYDIAGLSIPAKEAGGDYFDFIKLASGRLGIAIGDVSGKGVGAAIYMTLTKGIFQAHAEENVSPKHVLAKVNQLLYKTIEKNSFVSMIYSILDADNDKMIYSRAGQNPGIFCSNDGGNTKLLTSNGIALGLDPGAIFNRVLIEETVDITPGDVIVFYTDGFTEAMNERLEEYGEDRLRCMIENNRDKGSKEIIEMILNDVRDFVDVYPQHDDMTIVILKRNS